MGMAAAVTGLSQRGASVCQSVLGSAMKRLYLLRHAKSSWDDPSVPDFERPLNRRGRKAAKAMAKYFQEAGIHPAMVLCSPSSRTRETLDLMAPALDDVPVRFDNRIYEASSSALLACLQALPADVPSVLIIGHNPGLEHLAHALADQTEAERALARLREKFPTGSLAVLATPLDHWNRLTDGACRLETFVCPADLDGGE